MGGAADGKQIIVDCRRVSGPRLVWGGEGGGGGGVVLSERIGHVLVEALI